MTHDVNCSKEESECCVLPGSLQVNIARVRNIRGHAGVLAFCQRAEPARKPVVRRVAAGVRVDVIPPSFVLYQPLSNRRSGGAFVLGVHSAGIPALFGGPEVVGVTTAAKMHEPFTPAVLLVEAVDFVHTPPFAKFAR